MSQDQGMDVSPSWQELKDERDTWRDEALLKATEAEAFMLQRDQLWLLGLAD